MAFQIRRGTNQERLGITLVEGEIAYVTDSELKTQTVSSIDITTDVLSTDIEHGLVLNQQLRYLGLSQQGLVSNQVYFVKTTPSTTTFTLSDTLGGSTVNITGVTGDVDLQFAVSPTDLQGAPAISSVSPLWVGDGVTVGGYPGGSTTLDDLSDVEIGVYGNVGQFGIALADNQIIQYNSSTSKWENVSDPVFSGLTAGNITVGLDNDNTITTTTGGLVLAPADSQVNITGNLLVSGGNITGPTGQGNLFNTDTVDINIGNGATTAVRLGAPGAGVTQIKSAILQADGDIAVNGGDITTSSNIGNLYNAGTPVVNIGNGATTEVNLGADNQGQVQIKSAELRVNTGVINSTSTFASLYNTGVLEINIGSDATTAVRLGSVAGGITQVKSPILQADGDLAVNGGDITTSSANANLFNANAVDINIGNGATTALRLGNDFAGVTHVKSPLLQADGDVAVNGGDITTSSNIGNLFNTNATVVNIGNGATTEVNLGNDFAGRVQIKSPVLEAQGNAIVALDLAVNGGDITTSSNIGNLFNTNATVVNVGNAATTEVNLGNDFAGRVQIKSPLLQVNGEALIAGNLTVNGDLTYLNVADLQVEDKNIILARGNTTDAGADGGGITLKGTTDKTINWNTALNAWIASNGLFSPNIVAFTSIGTNGYEFYFNNADSTPSSSDNASLIVRRGAGADVVFRWNESTDRWQSTTDGSTYRTLPNQDLDTGNNAVFAGATLGNVRVGITTNNEIDTSTGNLTIDSAGGTTTIDDAVVINGATTVNTGNVQITAGTLTVSSSVTTTAGGFFADKVSLAGEGINFAPGNISGDTIHTEAFQLITTTSTTPTDMAMFAGASITGSGSSAIDFALQARRGNEFQVVKGMLLVDFVGNNTFLNIYSDLRTGSADLFTVSADLGPSNLARLLVSSSSADSTKYSGVWTSIFTPN